MWAPIFQIAATVEPPINRHIGDRSLVLCREVVPISEVGIEQTRSQTTLCLGTLVPSYMQYGCTSSLPLIVLLARVAPHCWNWKHNMAMAITCKNVSAITGNRGSVRSWCMAIVCTAMIILESIMRLLLKTFWIFHSMEVVLISEGPLEKFYCMWISALNNTTKARPSNVEILTSNVTHWPFHF